jgi:tetratricopeptide (TPR) repeat protein
LYETLTGRLPFGREFSAADGVADSILDQMDIAQRSRPVPVRSLNPRVDAGLAGIVERCLAYDAAARPESAAALAEGLRRSGNSNWARAIRWSLARRKLVGACLATVLLIGLATGMWAAQRDPYPVRQVRQGWAAYERAEYERAAESFSRAIEYDRKSIEALLGRARARIASGEHFLARDDLLAAQKLGDDARIEALLGYCSNRLETPSDAIPSYRRAMDMGLINAALVNDLGYSHQKLGNLSDAQIALDKALELNPDLAVARYNRALLAQQRCVNDHQEVGQETIDDILRAIELTPEVAELRLDAARILSMTRDAPARLDEIVNHIEQALDLGAVPAALSGDLFLKRWVGNPRFDALCRRPPAANGGEPATRVVDPLLVVKR